ncbi:hypothetical protein GT755_00050 [Herbidospora sp. NEAU-GS84]|uniref:Uncharacterized protein n=1 Tax=Herbidospora solisilvae TaxID=2696284 RepID=A0A7C9N4R4_9ACTN|nr:hypothetical protein [Herbidospora solisilvae]NAS20073.1 hypothetical protein [Herbidospora solisilvae]
MTSFEAIFDEPAAQDSDESAHITCTTYRATATRAGKQWIVNVHGLPDGYVVRVQGATWREAESNTITGITDALHVEPPAAVIVHMRPDDDEIVEALEAVTDARAARLHAELAEKEAVRAAAQTLVDKGWTTRDAGGVLRLSAQRISQLAPRTTA